jgi:hypothetical protein
VTTCRRPSCTADRVTVRRRCPRRSVEDHRLAASTAAVASATRELAARGGPQARTGGRGPAGRRRLVGAGRAGSRSRARRGTRPPMPAQLFGDRLLNGPSASTRRAQVGREVARPSPRRRAPRHRSPGGSWRLDAELGRASRHASSLVTRRAEAAPGVGVRSRPPTSSSRPGSASSGRGTHQAAAARAGGARRHAARCPRAQARARALGGATDRRRAGGPRLPAPSSGAALRRSTAAAGGDGEPLALGPEALLGVRLEALRRSGERRRSSSRDACGGVTREQSWRRRAARDSRQTAAVPAARACASPRGRARH